MTDFAQRLLPLPPGTPLQLVEFYELAMEKNEVLRENGASDQATAREALLAGFREACAEWLDGLLTVKEAARICDCSEETIRRWIRDEKLRSRQTGVRGHHKIRLGDLLQLDGEQPDRYDPKADAQDGAAPGRLQ